MTYLGKVPSIEGIASDKDRVNALYAPFRPRETNPEHYDRKLKFWLKAVDEYCQQCRRVSFTIKDLQKEFRVDGKAPACLVDVVDSICRNGGVLQEKDFQSNLKAAEGWKAWSQVSATKVLQKVGSYVPSPLSYFYKSTEEETRYININELQSLMEKVLSESSLLNKLMNIEKWRTSVSQLTQFKDPTDMEYLLGYLKAKKCLLMDKVGSEEVIIMTALGTTPKISDVEKGKYDIVRTKEILEAQLQTMTEKKDQAVEKAKASLKQGLRSTAKHELKRKKLLEQRMDKLLTMVDNLSVLESQIEDAESDAMLMSTYEAGKKALTNVLSDKRLDVDNVTDTMLDIQELLEQHSDVTAALSQPVTDQDPELAELDQELEDLLREDAQEKEEPVKTPPKAATTSVLTKEEEAEILKTLEELDLGGLDDFNEPSPSQAV